MEITIANQQKRVPVRSPAILRAAKRVLRHKRIRQGNLAIIFVSDPVIQKLNKKFLNKKHVTDVLAFDYTPAVSQKKNPKILCGEIIVSADRARPQARLYKTNVRQELTLYVIHGILHLLGFNDHAAKDIAAMRKEEQQIMRLLKMPLPVRK